MVDPVQVKKIREKISQDEVRLQKLIGDTNRIWEDTGLDSKEPSYLIEKTMRFELAQKTVIVTFGAFKEVIEGYKKLCSQLERTEETD
jgi:hypothetical protein